jgi:hypothetical protein
MGAFGERLKFEAVGKMKAQLTGVLGNVKTQLHAIVSEIEQAMNEEDRSIVEHAKSKYNGKETDESTVNKYLGSLAGALDNNLDTTDLVFKGLYAAALSRVSATEPGN